MESVFNSVDISLRKASKIAPSAFKDYVASSRISATKASALRRFLPLPFGGITDTSWVNLQKLTYLIDIYKIIYTKSYLQGDILLLYKEFRYRNRRKMLAREHSTLKT